MGHETDTTIIDFVSDLRAPTPSAAAELAVYDVTILSEQLEKAEKHLSGIMAQKVYIKKMQIQQKKLNLMNFSPVSRIREKRLQCHRNEEILKELFKKKLERNKYRLQIQIERLEGLSPLHKLQQGYSYAVNDENTNIRSISQVNKQERMEVYVADGKIIAQVEECVPLLWDMDTKNS